VRVAAVWSSAGVFEGQTAPVRATIHGAPLPRWCYTFVSHAGARVPKWLPPDRRAYGSFAPSAGRRLARRQGLGGAASSAPAGSRT
jgi:hypothetical protein